MFSFSSFHCIFLLFSGEKPLISKWCLPGEEVITTPRTTPSTTPPKPTYKPPETTPTPNYLPPIGEGGSKSNRNGKKLIDFVREFNSKSKASSKEEEDDDEVEEKADSDNNSDEEGIGEEFISDLVTCLDIFHKRSVNNDVTLIGGRRSLQRALCQ